MRRRDALPRGLSRKGKPDGRRGCSPRGLTLYVRMKGAQRWRAGSGTSAPEAKAPGDTEPTSGAAAARPELLAAPKSAEMAGPRKAAGPKAKEVRILGKAQGEMGRTEEEKVRGDAYASRASHQEQ